MKNEIAILKAEGSKEPIPFSGRWRTLIILHLWSDLLNRAIIESDLRIDSLAKRTNLVWNLQDPDNPKGIIKRNMIYWFLNSEEWTWVFSDDQRENICRKLKCWKRHPEHGELVGQADTQKLFPETLYGSAEDKVRDMCISSGFVVKAKYERKEGYYLTKKSLKLRRVEAALRMIKNNEIKAWRML